MGLGLLIFFEPWHQTAFFCLEIQYKFGVKGNEMKQHVQHAVLKQHAVTAKHWLKRMEKRDASCDSAWHLSATSSKGTTGLK